MLFRLAILTGVAVTLVSCNSSVSCPHGAAENDAGICVDIPSDGSTSAATESHAVVPRDGAVPGGDASSDAALSHNDASTNATEHLPDGGEVATSEVAAQDAENVSLDVDRNDATNSAVDAASACVPTTESCNGMDDDCDGKVDEQEDLKETSLGESCSNDGEGACAVMGVRICSGGAVVCGAPPPTPQPERCDGVDNDCNGKVDDGAAFIAKGTACTAGQGDCQGTGVWECDPADASKLRCTAVEKPKTCVATASCAPLPPEDCSTPTDDNCNGEANEGCAKVVSVSAGGASTCVALSTGSVKCWGKNGNGQLGDGFTIDRNRPTEVPGLNGAVQVAVGTAHACALLSDTTVRCWGRGDSGQLGNVSATSAVVLVPVTVQNLTGAVQLSAGRGKTCALLNTGAVYCWGEIRTGFSATTPQPLVGLPAVAEVSVDDAWAGACARLTTGLVRCWDQDSPPTEVPGVTDAVSVGTGGLHACAALSGGGVHCWSRGGSEMMAAVAGASDVTGAAAVRSGGGFSCARLMTGEVRCWGENSKGELGTGMDASGGPIRGLDATQLSAGTSHACALAKRGTVSCWGSNKYGQLGDGSPANAEDGNRYSPVTVVDIP